MWSSNLRMSQHQHLEQQIYTRPDRHDDETPVQGLGRRLFGPFCDVPGAEHVISHHVVYVLKTAEFRHFPAT